MSRKRIGTTLIILMAVISIACVGCNKATDTTGQYYTIPQLDLSGGEMYVVDDASDYLAHPDSILVRRGEQQVPSTILTVYPEGHGKGAILTKESSDGGKSWTQRRIDTPSSWADSKETPTIYRLVFNDSSERLVLISANPSWGAPHGDGFNFSYSDDEGISWTEFQKFYGWKTENYVNPIVAMASLTQLKDEQGNWTDSWMGVFHDYDFYNYKTILTFEGANKEIVRWSAPEKYFADYRSYEKNAQMCEVEIIRSDDGGELCLLGRSNRKKNNSIISFSQDEGKTWSAPKEVASALSGERHKAEYLQDGRLVITFRSVERDKKMYRSIKNRYKKNGWYSEGWIAWVGEYGDLKSMYEGNGNEGQYRIKLAHTYLPKQTEPQLAANADTGYCGNVVMPDGTFVSISYGCFGQKTSKGGYKTYIVAKVVDINEMDKLAGIV